MCDMAQTHCDRRDVLRRPRSILAGLRARMPWLLFAAVGGIAFGVDMVVLAVGVYGLGLAPAHARLISIPIAASAAWIINRRITFPGQRRTRRLFEWLRYLLANTGNLAINYGGYAAIVTFTAVGAAHPLISIIPGAFTGLCLNYWLASRWVFNRAQRARNASNAHQSSDGHQVVTHAWQRLARFCFEVTA